MKIKIDWPLVVAALIGVLLLWVFSITFAKPSENAAKYDTLMALLVPLGVLVIVSAWHFLAVLVRVAYWRYGPASAPAVKMHRPLRGQPYSPPSAPAALTRSQSQP